MSEQATCRLCGELMPPGEEMLNYHGYSGPCPKPPLTGTSRVEVARAALHRHVGDQIAASTAALMKAFDGVAPDLAALRQLTQQRDQLIDALISAVQASHHENCHFGRDAECDCRPRVEQAIAELNQIFYDNALYGGRSLSREDRAVKAILSAVQAQAREELLAKLQDPAAVRVHMMRGVIGKICDIDQLDEAHARAEAAEARLALMETPHEREKKEDK